MGQIHEQEGQIVEHVDAGKVPAELDAVEEGRDALQQADIAQMQIAMAEPHLACLAARLDESADPGQRLPAGRDQGGNRRRVEDRGHGRGQIGLIAVDDPGKSASAAEIPVDLGAAVKVCDPIGELAHQRRGESPLLGQAIEEAGLIEAAHDHDGIDESTLALEAEAAAGPAPDRAGLEIERGRGAPIQRQLGGAGRRPLLHRGEIEIAVAHGPLQLVGETADQEDGGDMGLDALDRFGFSAVARRILQEVDGLGLIPDDHRGLPIDP